MNVKQLREMYQEVNERLNKKYRYFCVRKDGRIVAYDIETGQYRGCLPTEFSKVRQFDCLAQPGEMKTSEVINYRDELGV